MKIDDASLDHHLEYFKEIDSDDKYWRRIGVQINKVGALFQQWMVCLNDYEEINGKEACFALKGMMCVMASTFSKYDAVALDELRDCCELIMRLYGPNPIKTADGTD